MEDLKKLSEALGFDPTKPPRVLSAVFGEALAEIQKERKEAAKEKAAALLREVIKIAMEWNGVEEKFLAEKKKFNKLLASKMKQIEAMSDGTDVAPPQDDPDRSKDG